MNSIVRVETLNGTEFVNLSTVRRFVPGTDGSLELRFGNAETLVLSEHSAKRVLAWVVAQAQAFQEAERQRLTAPRDTRQGIQTSRTGGRPPVKRVQLMPLRTTPPRTSPYPPTTHATLQAMAARASLRTPSPTINRAQWLPAYRQL